jgi:hypothetical protein
MDCQLVQGQDGIVCEDAAAFDRAAFGQRQAHAMAGVAEDWNSSAEEDGVDVQANLIDEVGDKKRLRQLTSADQADSLSRTMFKVAHKFDCVG